MPPKLSPAVRTARKITDEESTSSIQNAISIPENHQVQVHDALTISKNMRQQVWELYSDNMKSSLERSSFRWDPVEKQKEIFHKHGRLLLISSTGSEILLAFASYRFDVEENHIGAFEDVLYLYEVQVSPSARQRGFGALIMRCMDTLAQRASMFKVMLTVLIDNTDAIRLYSRASFLIDPNSPTQTSPQINTYRDDHGAETTGTGSDDDWGDEEISLSNEEADYLILSKLVPPNSS